MTLLTLVCSVCVLSGDRNRDEHATDGSTLGEKEGAKIYLYAVRCHNAWSSSEVSECSNLQRGAACSQFPLRGLNSTVRTVDAMHCTARGGKAGCGVPCFPFPHVPLFLR